LRRKVFLEKKSDNKRTPLAKFGVVRLSLGADANLAGVRQRGLRDEFEWCDLSLPLPSLELAGWWSDSEIEREAGPRPRIQIVISQRIKVETL